MDNSRNLSSASCDLDALSVFLSEQQLDAIKQHHQQRGITTWYEFEKVIRSDHTLSAELRKHGWVVEGQFINLNTCQPEQIHVPKITADTAARICEERDLNGQFLSWEDFKNRKIKAVGDAKVKYLQEYTFVVEPVLRRFYRDVNALDCDALARRGIPEHIVTALIAAREQQGFSSMKDIAERLGMERLTHLRNCLYTPAGRFVDSLP